MALAQVVVRSPEELRRALQDAQVDHIVMAERPEGYHLTPENFPSHSVLITDRTVTLEGGGPNRTYVDVSHECPAFLCRLWRWVKRLAIFWRPSMQKGAWPAYCRYSASGKGMEGPA